MVKRKKTEKRRKKYEQRLGPGVYMPKEERLAFNAEFAKLADAEEKATAEADKARKEEKVKKEKAKKALPADAKK